jgi:hypothetical protein
VRWFRVIGVLFCVFWGVHCRKAEEEGDKGLGGTTVFDVHALLEAFLNMPLRSTSFIDETFLVKSKTSPAWTAALKCWIIKISG